MALTPTVTKSNVRLAMPKMWAVTLTLTVVDDAPGAPGFTRTFAQNYKAGKSIPDLAAMYQDEMQKAIDQYKAERAIYDHDHLATLVTGVQAALEM